MTFAGTPRWTLRPDVTVGEGQDILAAGIRALGSRLHGA
jgi:hypothetical protein